MKNKTCCFTGHRDIPLSEYAPLKSRLKRAIIRLIEKGVLYFAAGGARGFDTLAAETVLRLKSSYPQIQLILVIPCSDQTKGWNKTDKETYEHIKRQADTITVLSDHYYTGCMQVRNRSLVDRSAYCIGYMRKSFGGTFYTLNYARKTHVEVIEI